MPCYKPLSAWRSKLPRPSTGKALIVFKSPSNDTAFEFIPLPCGQCIGCRLDRSRQWAVRCMHEASLHDDNCFITLTFSEENLDSVGSLRKRDFQLFMKRLRERFPETRIRYFHCGEYGERLGRPHHHACLFGFDFPDKLLLRVSDSGHKIYTSEILWKLWDYGLHEIGAVTFESAAYVARYVLKKQLGRGKGEHYMVMDDVGSFHDLEEEYTTMSRRPGIGRGWFDKFESDIFPLDECVLEGKFYKVPKYYNRRFELTNAKVYDKIRRKRIEKAKASSHNSQERLNVREKIQHIRADKLLRSYEHE